jgi:signal transduction histidine kinase
VNIRHTLLRAFLLIGLVPAIALAALAFVKARQAMEDEIERGLANQAHAVAADINKVLFERLQNGAAWSTLEVMQDVLVQDVDKRLSNFLAKLVAGYGGVYRHLYVTDRAGVVVAASDAALLGRRLPAAPAWQRVTLAGSSLTLERPRRSGRATLLHIRVRLYDQFSHAPQGELVLAMDWAPVQELLDHAADGHALLLLERDGTVLARAGTLATVPLAPGLRLADWALAGRAEGAFEHAAPGRTAPPVLAGLGRAPQYAGFDGIGLSTLVLQERAAALAPVRHMAELSLAILLLLVLATVAAASRISAALAGPIAALTAFTRHYRLGQDAQIAPPAASGEVGELGSAFAQMMREIDEARSSLVHASKLAAIGEMAAVIIHEVRTPLGILRSSSQMLRRETGISEQGRELLGFIESETERLNRLVSAMLDSARARPPLKVDVDLHQLIRQAGALLASQLAERGIVIEEHLQAAAPCLRCDPEQMTQVLLNLLHNALQILAHGGTIRIGTRDGDGRLTIVIDDDGPGIAPAERNRIFEAFFCRREGGVGLGLAIVRQIVLAHDGDIRADASPAGGARFIIGLPRAAPL